MALLDDLRKSSDPLAALLAMSDSELDRVAAEVQGWELDRIEFDDFHSCRKYRACWCYDKQPSGFGKYIERRKYKPSRKLDQAYELLGYCRLKCGLYHSRVEDWDDTYHTLGRPMEDVFDLNESQAGSHARAVVVLAILGLVGKDGAA